MNGVKIPKIFSNTNEIYFHSKINRQSIDTLLLLLKSKTATSVKKSEPLRLYIHSTGGTINETIRAVHALKTFPRPVITINNGIVASAATLLFVVGKERLAIENSYFLYHQPNFDTARNYTHQQIKDELAELQILDEYMKQIYMECSKGVLTEQTLHALLKQDSYLTTRQAMKFGLLDDIL